MDRLTVILHVAFCLTVLVAETCSSSSQARTVLYRPKRQDECQLNQFRCKSGACIDTSFVCNGTAECRDGSDETEDACKQLYGTPLPETQEGCFLPQQPEFGSYTSPACKNDKTTCRQVPGTPVPQHWLLSFKCNYGYYINGTEDEVFHFCINGSWYGKIPICRKMCSPLISLSVAVKCQYQGDDIDCSKPMKPGTQAIGSCKPLYDIIRPPPYHDIICRENGMWSYELFYCEPVCGKGNVKRANTPFRIESSVSTKLSEFPWHTGLYMKNTANQWEQMCGGSLISPHIVLTAAHCVFPEITRKLLSPADVKVGLGKYYREWTHDEPYAVKSDVREIVIPPRYHGGATSYAHDIALIDLTHSVQINTNIMPVCVDWDLQFTITPGMLGTLAGWGETENGSFSDVLVYGELLYIEYRECIFGAPPAFQHNITPDKFCAGYTNGSVAGRGNSGAGLTFRQNDLHYVYGILSTKASSNSLVFTNVSNTELFDWLNHAKNRLDAVHPET